MDSRVLGEHPHWSLPWNGAPTMRIKQVAAAAYHRVEISCPCGGTQTYESETAGIICHWTAACADCGKTITATSQLCDHE